MTVNEEQNVNARLVDEDERSLEYLEQSDNLFSICSPVQGSVLGLLAQSRSTDVDPAPFLDALAAELLYSDRVSVKDMADLFREGSGLVDVVEASHEFFPSPVRLATRLAHDSGKLDGFCDSIANRPMFVPTPANLVEQTPFGRVAWVIWQGGILLFFMAFIMLFIIPQFQEMFIEFGIKLPPATIFLMRVASFFCRWWFVFFGVAAIFAIRHFIHWYPRFRRRFSSVHWNQKEHSPAVQSKLNLACLSDSGLGFLEGLSLLARFEPHRRTASKIQKAVKRTVDGQDPWKALAITGVLSEKESMAIETASSPETRSWLLRQMAFAESRRVRTWSTTRVRLFTSLANIVMGLLVLLFCVGLFAPLIFIIRGLSG